MAIANPAAIKTSGGDYTTIQAWEDALVNDEGVLVGECYGEVFTKVLFSGVAYNSTNYPHLTAHSGNEHDGRAHELSGEGNARIEYVGASYVFQYNDAYVRVSWLEIKGPGTNGYRTFRGFCGEAGTAHIHHNIIHNNLNTYKYSQAGASFYYSTVEYRVYRNIFYGFGYGGITLSTAGANSAFLQNTVFEINYSSALTCSDVDWVIKSNALFNNSSRVDIANTTGTYDYNATSDTTGAEDPPVTDGTGEGTHGLISLTATDQFVNAVNTNMATIDLLPKAGAGILDKIASGDLATVFGANYLTDYPEIDESINNRGTSITGAWDIGAGQYVAAAAGSSIPILRRRRCA